ncbi:hypothetical protein BCR39DRAFT_523558 [Naematelia encephala]|uniref:Uncharacterized protein n=1 Tax=Naematelia encephala TaxID=71784 RepID=A0A1Y2BCN8_9TREE|nr:hypothetical protein BCR39DRAFT_523558 [Naematelia encephala]
MVRKLTSDQGFPTPPPSRRPSILSQLVSRPNFAFSHSTPATPLSTSHPKESGLPSGLAMTPSTSHDQPIQHFRRKSMPSGGGGGELPLQSVNGNGNGNGIVRSSTMKVAGFNVGVGKATQAKAQAQVQVQGKVGETRHFDPSRDPKLLGLL